MKKTADRRKGQRQRVYKAGKVLFGKRLCVFDCTVVDRSAGGARLRLEAPEFVPNRFTLRIPKENLEAQAVVANRNGAEIGVMLSA